jgi:hypothetical protein
MDILNEFAELTAQINVYDIFGICWGLDPYPQMIQGPQKHKGVPITDYTPWAKIPRKEGQNELPPCTWGSGLLDYMNADETKEALHIPDYVQAWDLCKSGIDYVIQPKGSQWIYEALAGKYKMLHYSGDVDGAVPTDGTQAWIATLGWDTEEEWRSYMVDGQVAGYLESYQGGLTFGTVHGAGHMAPQFKPPQTYHLVFNWMLDREI